MGKTLEEAVAFARSHDMTVFVGDITVRVAYPCGDEQTFMKYATETPQEIIDMTCRML